MKTFMRVWNRNLLVALIAVGGLNQAIVAAEPTAFELVKEGNRHVGEEAKGRVVQVRSEKSVGGLTPNIWYVVYYDPDATAKAIEVKFAAGQKVAVKRPARWLEPITRSHRELPKEKLKIDSDKAIQIAKSDPLLKNLTLTNTEMRLERGEGDQPVWKVKLWAAKIRKTSETVHIGQIHISAEDGKVVKNDLKPGRVD
jgi:hypothetical protein